MIADQFDQPEFWHRLIPELTIEESVPLAETSTFGTTLELSPDHWEPAQRCLQEQGYLAYPGWLHPSLMDQLAAAFLTLERNDLPTIFAFVYDQFWDVLLQLDPLLSELIDDYELPAAIWTWLVRPENGTAFPPHRDQIRDAGLGDDEHLDYLTLWIPLTDLNHASSNICVVPASVDPDYGQGINRTRIDDLQSIRCLQGPRGSVFAWTTGLIHWGTAQLDPSCPRMSIGACVQSPDAYCYDPPLLSFYEPFPLADRLAIVARQIINYAPRMDSDWLQWAENYLSKSEI